MGKEVKMNILSRIWRFIPFNIGAAVSNEKPIAGIRGTFTVWKWLVSVDIGWT